MENTFTKSNETNPKKRSIDEVSREISEECVVKKSNLGNNGREVKTVETLLDDISLELIIKKGDVECEKKYCDNFESKKYGDDFLKSIISYANLINSETYTYDCERYNRIISYIDSLNNSKETLGHIYNQYKNYDDIKNSLYLQEKEIENLEITMKTIAKFI